MDARRLFDGYNKRYWQGRLPHYSVVITNLYAGGRCDKRHRKIYINPSHPDGVRGVLLHEMVHAAVRNNQRDPHGKVWLEECKRLRRLGAPLTMELASYESGNVKTEEQLLLEFEDVGFNGNYDIKWSQVRLTLGKETGLVNKNGHAPDRECARILEKARRQWHRGRAKRIAISPIFRRASFDSKTTVDQQAHTSDSPDRH